MASGSTVLVMMGVALIAAGALGLFFIRTFIGAIGLIGDVLPINTSTQTVDQRAAAALGLGSCWVGAFRDEEVARIIGAPGYVRPIAIIPVGYPAEKPVRPPRRGYRDFLHVERLRLGS